MHKSLFFMSEFSEKLKNAYANAYDMKNKGVVNGT